MQLGCEERFILLVNNVELSKEIGDKESDKHLCYTEYEHPDRHLPRSTVKDANAAKRQSKNARHERGEERPNETTTTVTRQEGV